MTLGLVDDELRVLAAEVRLQHDGDRGPDVVLGVLPVDVGAGDVPQPTSASTRTAPRSVSGSSIGLDRVVGHVGGQHDPPPGGERVDVQQPQAGAGRGQQGGVLELLGVGLGLAERVELPQLRA